MLPHCTNKKCLYETDTKPIVTYFAKCWTVSKLMSLLRRLEFFPMSFFFLKTARTPLLMSNKRISTPAWKNLFIKGSMHRGEESVLHGRNNRVMSCWWMFRTIIVLISDVTVTWTVIPLITTWKLQVTLRNRLSWIGTLRNCSTRNIELHNWNKFRGMLLS